MNKSLYRLSIIITVIGFAFCVSSTTFAANQAVKIDDRHTLYLITFNLAHDRYTLTIPDTMSRTKNRTVTTDITYATQNPEGLTTSDGLTVGMIFGSTTKIANGYQTSPGMTTSFTLAVLHQKATSSSRTNTVAVRHFPFAIKSPTGTSMSMLSQAELKKFITSATGTPALIRE